MVPSKTSIGHEFCGVGPRKRRGGTVYMTLVSCGLSARGLTTPVMAAKVFAKQDFPPRFAELKKQIVDSNPEAQARLTAAWVDLLKELSTTTGKIKKQGSDVSVVILSAAPLDMIFSILFLLVDPTGRIRGAGGVVCGYQG